jgi:aldose 1-epimerase
VPAPATTVATAEKPAEKKAVSPIVSSEFGTLDGAKVQLYTLTNQNGLVLKATNYGAIVTELQVPDKAGKLADIVLGFETLDEYVKSSPYFGATVGRVANRIKNARFELAGKQYKVAANNAPHHLHGGVRGWDKVLWTASTSETPDGPAIKFTYVSKDGEENYPGNVSAQVTYTLTNRNEFKVEMSASTDKTTLVNMAHHTYWNLGGQNSGTILDHELTLHASAYTPGDLVPDGTQKAVKGTPFDFTAPKPIGKDLKEAGGKPNGFDHNFIVDGAPQTLRPVAKLKDPKSGRVMLLEADQPGVQFYSGNFLDGSIKGKGTTYAQHAALCLESQKFPNSINVPAWRANVILEPGKTYTHTMLHRFTAE